MMPGVVYHPGPCYPTAWQRLVALFGRKNQKPNAKPQKPRKIKGRKKPPHRGGASK